jgi:hypothetical protein
VACHPRTSRSDGCLRRDVQTAAGDFPHPASQGRLPGTGTASGTGQPFRKEVIQPQVPLRLPCYDFTPVADPTVDACLPCGLAQRLRVEPTPMV